MITAFHRQFLIACLLVFGLVHMFLLFFYCGGREQCGQKVQVLRLLLAVKEDGGEEASCQKIDDILAIEDDEIYFSIYQWGLRLRL